jgi:L-asparaginase / beta-aspartyl-peptidase
MRVSRKALSVALMVGAAFVHLGAQQAAQSNGHQWTLVVHGGAGEIERAALGAEGDAAYRASLTKGIEAGSKVLDSGGSAVDAVEAVLKTFEDDPLFNAAHGAVFTSEGKNELDASIMDGSNLMAGAVVGVMHTRYPIALARAVMDKSPYVMMAGPGAEAFGARVGLEQVEPSFFFTEARWQSLVKQLTKEGKPVPPRPVGAPPPGAIVPVALYDEPGDSRSHGTTGAVALDRHGNIAAGTSTGGMQGKMPGRVGDSPIIGAGTYASNHSCAVSATGSGEYFIRLGVAREICNLVAFKGMAVQQAADEVIHHELEALNGDGGVIVLTPDGQTAFSFNTPGMFRARLSEGGKLEVHIYKDEQ